MNKTNIRFLTQGLSFRRSGPVRPTHKWKDVPTNKRKDLSVSRLLEWPTGKRLTGQPIGRFRLLARWLVAHRTRSDHSASLIASVARRVASSRPVWLLARCWSKTSDDSSAESVSNTEIDSGRGGRRSRRLGRGLESLLVRSSLPRSLAPSLVALLERYSLITKWRLRLRRGRRGG